MQSWKNWRFYIFCYQGCFRSTYCFWRLFCSVWINFLHFRGPTIMLFSKEFFGTFSTCFSSFFRTSKTARCCYLIFLLLQTYRFPRLLFVNLSSRPFCWKSFLLLRPSFVDSVAGYKICIFVQLFFAVQHRNCFSRIPFLSFFFMFLSSASCIVSLLSFGPCFVEYILLPFAFPFLRLLIICHIVFCPFLKILVFKSVIWHEIWEITVFLYSYLFFFHWFSGGSLLVFCWPKTSLHCWLYRFTWLDSFVVRLWANFHSFFWLGLVIQKKYQ